MYVLRQADKLTQHDWYVGGKKPRHKDGRPFEDVCEVYADGPELEKVRQRCINIPDIPGSASVVWKRPFAQFIYDSLVYEPEPEVPKVPRPQRRQ